LYQPRIYREEMNRDRFRFFQCSHLESDLLIGVAPGKYRNGMEQTALGEILRIRGVIEGYATRHPEFITSLEPLKVPGLKGSGHGNREIPPEIAIMLRCGEESGTGPMSSVAGLFAEKVGACLKMKYGLAEVLVENGGDLFMENRSEATVAVHAGDSPLSGKLALNIPPGSWGICTSSGTVGHSFSFGKADAVTVISGNAALADAWATSLANRVSQTGDIDKVLDRIPEIRGILGCVVILRDRVGIRGQFELKPLT
jgi:ApbE superfamily uncharacterized protein (UPF0280 family)